MWKPPSRLCSILRLTRGLERPRLAGPPSGGPQVKQLEKAVRGQRMERRDVSVAEAKEILRALETEKLLSAEAIVKEAIQVLPPVPAPCPTPAPRPSPAARLNSAPCTRILVAQSPVLASRALHKHLALRLCVPGC